MRLHHDMPFLVVVVAAEFIFKITLFKKAEWNILIRK